MSGLNEFLGENVTDFAKFLRNGPALAAALLQDGLLKREECEFGFEDGHRTVLRLVFREGIRHIPVFRGREELLKNALRSLMDFCEDNLSLRITGQKEAVTGIGLLLLLCEGQLRLTEEEGTITLRVPRATADRLGASQELFSEFAGTICRFCDGQSESRVILEDRGYVKTVPVAAGLTLSFEHEEPEELPEEEPEEELPEELPEEEPEEELPEELPEAEPEEELPEEELPEAEPEEELPEELPEEEPEEELPEEELPETTEAAETGALTERELNIRKNTNAALLRAMQVFESMHLQSGEELPEKEEAAEEPEEPVRPSFRGPLLFTRRRRYGTEHYLIDVPDGFRIGEGENGAPEFVLNAAGTQEPVFVFREIGFAEGESLGQRIALDVSEAGGSAVYDIYLQVFSGVVSFRAEVYCPDAPEAAGKAVREILKHIS